MDRKEHLENLIGELSSELAELIAELSDIERQEEEGAPVINRGVKA